MINTSSLTDRQLEIYYFIRNQITQESLPPTVREIGNQFNIISTNGVLCHLTALEKKGLIKRHKNRARAIMLTSPV